MRRAPEGIFIALLGALLHAISPLAKPSLMVLPVVFSHFLALFPGPFSDISPDSGSPQIPKESEGTRSRGKYQKKDREKGRIFSDSRSPQIPLESEGTRNRRRHVPRKFIEFSGDPASAVENRKRFSTADERSLRAI